MQEVKKISAVLELDSDKFVKNLSAINTQLKASESEFNKNKSSMELYGKTSETLANTQQSLSTKLDGLKSKVALYGEQLQKNNSELNKNQKELEELGKKKEALNRKYEESVKLTGTESAESQKLAKELKDVTAEYNKKENQVRNNVNTINKHTTELNKTEQELNKTEKELQHVTQALQKSNEAFKIAGKSTEELQSSLKSTGDKLNTAGNNILKLSAPLIGIGAISIKTGAEFEAAMSNVEAISGATGKELELLEQTAKDMGAATSKSAKESADAMGYMALAGWDVTQIVGGIEPVLRLAEAGNLDLARASDLVTDSMSALGLEVEELPTFLDKVAQTSAKANTNIDALMEAFLIVGGKANSLGVDINELSAVLGVMANRGIKGAEAGRGLSAILTNLTTPVGAAAEVLGELGLSAFDTEGNFIGLESVFKNLDYVTRDLTQEQRNLYLSQIAGKEHAKTLNAIMASLSEEYEGLEQDIRGADGALGKMAKTMQDNTKGQFTVLKSQLEGVAIQLAEHLLPHVSNLIEGLSKLVTWFGNLSPETQKTIVNFGLMATATGGVLKVAGGLTSSIGNIIGLFGKLAPVVTGATSGFGGLATGVAGLGGSLGGIGTTILSVLPTIAPFVVAIGGIAAAGYAVNKVMSQDVIPTVDLFADKIVMQTETVGGWGTVVTQETIKISDATREAVGAYIELDTQAQDTLMSMTYGYEETSRISQEKLDEMRGTFYEFAADFGEKGDLLNSNLIAQFEAGLNEVNLVTGEGLDEVVTQFAEHYFETEEVTEEMKNKVVEMFGLMETETTSTTQQMGEQLIATFAEMNKMILDGNEEMRSQDLESLKGFLENSKLINAEEYNDMVQQTNKAYDEKKQTVEDTQNKIKEILTRAKDEHRALTQEEVTTINQLQQQMKENAVKILSQNEVEANVILERMKAHNTRVTAEQAQKHIEELNKQRDGAIAAAEEEYNKVLESIIRMRDETGVITTEQADKMIEEATRQKDETIKRAEETRDGAVETIFSMNEDLKGNVNETTGEIMSWWDKLKNWWSGWTPEPKEFTVTKTERTIVERQERSVPANALGTSYFQGGLTTINEKGFELIDLPRGSKIYNHEASERYLEKAVEKLYNKIFESQKQGDQIINIYSPKQLNSFEISKQLKRTQRELALERIR